MTSNGIGRRGGSEREPAAHPLGSDLPAASVPGERDPFFDNARFLLMALVVIGHAFERMQSVSVTRHLYEFLYVFHMPAFIFISGYLSHDRLDRRVLDRLFRQLLLPYVVFQLLYLVLAHLLDGSLELRLALTRPHHHLWFLLSLLCWRLLWPLLADVRFLLPLTVGVGLLAGCLPDVGGPFSIGRTLVFFPFFVAGAQLARSGRALLFPGWAKALAVPALLLVLGATWLDHPTPLIRILYGKQAFAALGLEAGQGLLLRSLAYLGALVAGGAFLALVPRRKLAFTEMGARTTPSYLLHVAPIAVAASFGGFAALAASLPGPAVVLVVALAALALHLVCSLPVMNRLISGATSPSPRSSWALAATTLAIAALLTWLGSVSYARSDRTTLSAIRRAAAAAGVGVGDSRGMAIPAAGLRIDLGRRVNTASWELSATPGPYELRFFSKGKPVGGVKRWRKASAVVVKASRAAASLVMRAPRAARRNGYDTVVLRPLGERDGGHRLLRLAPRKAKAEQAAPSTKKGPAAAGSPKRPKI